MLQNLQLSSNVYVPLVFGHTARWAINRAGQKRSSCLCVKEGSTNRNCYT